MYFLYLKVKSYCDIAFFLVTDVPPLEDMSELMQQLEGVNEYKSFQQQSAVPEKLRLVNDQLEYSTHKQPSNDIPQTKDNQVVEVRIFKGYITVSEVLGSSY